MVDCDHIDSWYWEVRWFLEWELEQNSVQMIMMVRDAKSVIRKIETQVHELEALVQGACSLRAFLQRQNILATQLPVRPGPGGRKVNRDGHSQHRTWMFCARPKALRLDLVLVSWQELELLELEWARWTMFEGPKWIWWSGSDWLCCGHGDAKVAGSRLRTSCWPFGFRVQVRSQVLLFWV